MDRSRKQLIIQVATLIAACLVILILIFGSIATLIV